MIKISLKFYKNLFHALFNNLIIKKRHHPPKKLKAVKDRGKFRVGMTAVKDSMALFFEGFPKVSTKSYHGYY